MDLAGALGLDSSEFVAFVGAGGKKTAMQRLVCEADECSLATGYTTTTHMPPPPEVPLVVVRPDELSDTLRRQDAPLAFASERITDPERVDEKVRGFDPTVIDQIADADVFDWVLVKADGARRRAFKAPTTDEPAIPQGSTHVVPVASVEVVGKRLDERHVHRVDRVAAITGLSPGDRLDADAVGTVLAHSDGGLKGVPDAATVTPIVNKADTPPLREVGRQILEATLDHADRPSRGLVTSFETESLDVVDGDDDR